MCGIVGYIGNDLGLIQAVVEESKIRGLHNLGHRQLVGAGIYHTRYCTSGKDNQPIVKPLRSLVMNGVISMGTKAEMEKEYDVKMTTDNDAELLSIYWNHSDFDEICKLWPWASMAALILKEDQLFAMRNEKRPLWMIEKGKSVLLASTQDIFKRAGADWERAKLLKPFKTYAWTI